MDVKGALNLVHGSQESVKASPARLVNTRPLVTTLGKVKGPQMLPVLLLGCLWLLTEQPSHDLPTLTLIEFGISYSPAQRFILTSESHITAGPIAYS